MSKITADQLACGAYVYVRQSTPDQLLLNHESRRRQYGLAERARQLGWSDVHVVDDDLGRSGSGAVSRPGFERLLVAICEGRVGAVFSVEAPRLARNGRDLAHAAGVLRACQLRAGRRGRGIRPTPCERSAASRHEGHDERDGAVESMLRQRSLEALKLKAKRGELFFTVAVGYVKVRQRLIPLGQLPPTYSGMLVGFDVTGRSPTSRPQCANHARYPRCRGPFPTSPSNQLID
jgi:hypothetical protein